MVQRTVLLLGLLLLFVMRPIAAFAMDVQLPFVDGERFECVQNSDDFPTHGRFENGTIDPGATSTRFDLDFGLPQGTIVTAGADGIVSHGSNPGGFGNYIRVDHENGLWTIYAHLMDNGYIAREGDQVVAGQPIGFSGSTGRSTGPHLHFGVHQGNGVGESVKTNVKAREYSHDGAFKREGFFQTGSQEEREMYCQNNLGTGNKGNKYMAIPLSGLFNQFQCHTLDNDRGLLCWQGDDSNFAFCDDGTNHTRYWRTGGGYRSEAITLAPWNVADMCYPSNQNGVDLYSYLDGGSIGVGGSGTTNIPTDPPTQNLPDFSVRKTWLATSWGTETYKFGMNESFDTKAQSENIGDGSCLGTEIQTITGHFYLSKRYKEDPHSGDGAWRRVDSTTTKCDNLKSGDTHTETKNTVIREWITEPGIYNIVYCIDHPRDDHNNGGDHQEKHESNNCSTEAVFEVTADPIVNQDPRFVDFVTSGLQFRQAPYYAGDQARFGATVTNQGNIGSTSDIRSSYSIQCPGTGLIYLTDDGTKAGTLTAGASAFEENLNPVTLPNVAGACTAYFCADYQGAVGESNETNNCTSLSFVLQPRPKPRLVITKFQDESGCCTTNTGSRIKPNIWVRNDGPVSPASDVSVLYQISSPVATGGQWHTIGYGFIRPSELPPGGTDEDYMDGSWSVPKNSAWKKQWHTVRACLKADGSTPTGDQNQDVCATYARYSKK